MKFNGQKLKIGIVGAGPAGAMSAYLMAQKGHEVTLFERKRVIDRKVCGEYLCPMGVALLKRLNIFEKVCGQFLDLQGMVLNSPSEISVVSFFPEGRGGVQKGVSVNRQIFDQNLINLALETKVEFLTGKTVAKVSKNSDKKWKVEITKEESYTFDLLVAADGRQSKIGSLLGHMNPIDTRRAALHVFLPRKTDRGERFGEMHILSENRYCGLDPINDDEVNFSVVCDSYLLKTKTPTEIINDVILSTSRLRDMFDLVDPSADIKIVTALKNKNHFVAGDNLAYVGDAAGFIDPLTGEGIYNAILSGWLLVDSLLQTQTIEAGLLRYKREKWRLSFQKNVLNHFFQFLIQRPKLVNWVGTFLSKSQKRADHFIGIIGNIHGPLEGLVKMLKI